MLMLHDYRVRQRDLLLDIARALTEKLDLNEVLRRILEASTSMLAGEIGLIVLRSDHDQLQVQAALGVADDKLWVFDDLLEDFQTLGFDAERLNARTRQLAKRLDLPLRQVIALPMIMSAEPLGLVLVFRTFSGLTTLDDRQILQSFADQAAIAVHNARLYTEVINEKQRLAAILEHSADGIMILDDDLTIYGFNQALGRMTGWEPEMALGRQYQDIIRWKQAPPLDLPAMLQRDNWHQDHSQYTEGDLLRLDGSLQSVGITFALLQHPDGKLGSIIANIRDITNFRRAERMKETFISIISHELKTPVALIKGYAGTLNRPDATWSQAEIQQAMQVIEEEADRLTSLIENLLAASKLKAEGMELKLSDVSLASLVARAVERFQTQSEQHSLDYDFPADFPIIEGDEARLRQVIDNLLSNAIKYSPDGGTVRVRGSFDDHSVTLSVEDEGIGLPPDQQRQIFERFYRVDDELSRSTQGTGLGLYLARAVIEAHGGKIWAASNAQRGSTFTFTLPRDA